MTGRAIDLGSAPPARGRRAELLDSHSRAAAIIFWLKSRGLIVRRILSNLAPGEFSRRYARSATIPEGAQPLALDEHPIYTETDPRERELELGKVQNLRIAAASVDGIILEPGETFSFWRAAGRGGEPDAGAIRRRPVESGAFARIEILAQEAHD